jgi:1-aminocyclopropane-1-carboxylate deaminase/D-cysteine desulfhydrase
MLDDHPRVPLAPLPTPLEPAPRLSAALGAEIWLKRDDVGSLGLAGNKVRKLEFALGQARHDGATAVVTLGAAQSNHARATAAACARLGMRCVLVMRGDPPGGQPTGNLLLDRLFGAEVRFACTDDWIEVATQAHECGEQLRREQEQPVVLPAGCSSPEGALGFAAAYLELLGQLDEQRVEATRIVHACTSGGTHAGLLVGRALAGRGPEVRAFDVGRLTDDVDGFVAQLARDTAALLGRDETFDVALDASQLGEGYGAFTGAATEAIRLVAGTEGIALDPVYSGKAMAGLVADAAQGRLEGPVVFWHTGGGPSLFARGWAEPLFGTG